MVLNISYGTNNESNQDVNFEIHCCRTLYDIYIIFYIPIETLEFLYCLNC